LPLTADRLLAAYFYHKYSKEVLHAFHNIFPNDIAPVFGERDE